MFSSSWVRFLFRKKTLVFGAIIFSFFYHSSAFFFVFYHLYTSLLSVSKENCSFLFVVFYGYQRIHFPTQLLVSVFNLLFFEKFSMTTESMNELVEAGWWVEEKETGFVFLPLPVIPSIFLPLIAKNIELVLVLCLINQWNIIKTYCSSNPVFHVLAAFQASPLKNDDIL